ncbi:hypothetical protein LCGC14_3102700, partial [marine sediment metagenome]
MNDTNLFHTLPDEILSHIASFLVYDNQSRCAFTRACCRFYGVAHDVFDQKPAFQYACRHRYTEIVKLLLADGRVDPTADNNWAFRLSSKKGHTDVVRLLLEDGRADPTSDNNLAIQLSCKNGHTDVVKLLLADGRADPSASNNKWGGISFLTGRPADPAAYGNNLAIQLSSRNGHTDVVRLLLADGRADPTANDSYALQWSISFWHTDV